MWLITNILHGSTAALGTPLAQSINKYLQEEGQ